MTIRKSTLADLDTIMDIYSDARQFMVDNGNPTQWGKNHPSRELIEKDITKGISYVCEDESGLQGVFVYLMDDDPTYQIIEKGDWLDNAPYGVIHRLASAGTHKGVAKQCFSWCFEQCGNLRIDTHENNKVMQYVIEQSGFLRCGRIYAEDGTPRIAYQKIRT